MSSKHSEIAIIGGGPAGYVAAIKAAQMKKKVVLIEEAHLGGTCLNEGCIPTKALAKTAALYANLKRSEEFGLEKGEVKIHWPLVQKRKEEIVAALRQGVEGLVRANKIEMFKGKASFLSPGVLLISFPDDQNLELRAEKVIIASGSSLVPIPGFQIDEENILSSKGILSLPSLPQSLVVIGGGVIGLEFASIFSLLGVAVTVLEILPHILPGIDPEAAMVVAGEMQKRGVKIWTKARVEKIEEMGKGQLRVKFCQEDEAKVVTAEKVLVAAGRGPNTNTLGLEKIDVKLKGGAIQVNSRMETNVPGVYAAGDVIGGYMLAHVAFAEGEIAALNAAETKKEISYRSVPACTYTFPEVAQVGLSESEAREKYREVRIGKFPLRANGKAMINGEIAGFVKIVSDSKYGEVLGVNMVGEHATELIAEAGLAVGAEITVDQLSEIMHAHPTVSEAMREAGLAALGVPLHTL